MNFKGQNLGNYFKQVNGNKEKGQKGNELGDLNGRVVENEKKEDKGIQIGRFHVLDKKVGEGGVFNNVEVIETEKKSEATENQLAFYDYALEYKLLTRGDDLSFALKKVYLGDKNKDDKRSRVEFFYELLLQIKDEKKRYDVLQVFTTEMLQWGEVEKSFKQEYFTKLGVLWISDVLNAYKREKAEKLGKFIACVEDEKMQQVLYFKILDALNEKIGCYDYVLKYGLFKKGKAMESALKELFFGVKEGGDEGKVVESCYEWLMKISNEENRYKDLKTVLTVIMRWNGADKESKVKYFKDLALLWIGKVVEGDQGAFLVKFVACIVDEGMRKAVYLGVLDQVKEGQDAKWEGKFYGKMAKLMIEGDCGDLVVGTLFRIKDEGTKKKFYDEWFNQLDCNNKETFKFSLLCNLILLRDDGFVASVLLKEEDDLALKVYSSWLIKFLDRCCLMKGGFGDANNYRMGDERLNEFFIMLMGIQSIDVRLEIYDSFFKLMERRRAEIVDERLETMRGNLLAFGDFSEGREGYEDLFKVLDGWWEKGDFNKVNKDAYNKYLIRFYLLDGGRMVTNDGIFMVSSLLGGIKDDEVFRELMIECCEFYKRSQFVNRSRLFADIINCVISGLLIDGSKNKRIVELCCEYRWSFVSDIYFVCLKRLSSEEWIKDETVLELVSFFGKMGNISLAALTLVERKDVKFIIALYKCCCEFFLKDDPTKKLLTDFMNEMAYQVVLKMPNEKGVQLLMKLFSDGDIWKSVLADCIKRLMEDEIDRSALKQIAIEFLKIGKYDEGVFFLNGLRDMTVRVNYIQACYDRLLKMEDGEKRKDLFLEAIEKSGVNYGSMRNEEAEDDGWMEEEVLSERETVVIEEASE